MQKKFYFLIFVSVCCSISFANNLSEHPRTWLSLLQDEAPLCQLSIPGTHNSGANKGGIFMKCQDASIKEQLEAGIRAFDIRLRVHKKALEVCHSTIGMGTFFDTSILKKCTDFLTKHPSETILLILKCDNGDEVAYATKLSQIISTYKKWIVMNFKNKMTLANVRGKILCLHRSNIADRTSGGYIRGFQNNSKAFRGSILFASGLATTYRCEDYYSLSKGFLSGWDRTGKINAIKTNLQQSKTTKNTSECWYLTFLSGTALTAFVGPKKIAKAITPAINNWIKEKGAGSYGILFMDFATSNQTKGTVLTNTLIDSNRNWKKNI